jgi:hypothetical protein
VAGIFVLGKIETVCGSFYLNSPSRIEAHPPGYNSVEKIVVHFVQNERKSMKSARRNIFLLMSREAALNTSLIPNL